MVRKTERTEPLLTLPLSGQAAILSRIDVLFQRLNYLVSGFSWTQEGMRIRGSMLINVQVMWMMYSMRRQAPSCVHRCAK